MGLRETALTDDMRAAVALRHLDARDRARGNAEAHELSETTVRGWYAGASWALHWRKVEREHEADARAILPPADGYEHAAPAFVGGAT